jgi:2-iminobutanoate/2-iminopropanoate deaminase
MSLGRLIALAPRQQGWTPVPKAIHRHSWEIAMKKVKTETAPPPAGHYSQAVVHDGLVYVSGQIPIDVEGKVLGDAPIEVQVETVLGNIRSILQAAGSDLDRTLQMTVYVTDIASWGRVNETYARVMGSHRPARAIVPVRDLHHGIGVEIQAIAAIDQS